MVHVSGSGLHRTTEEKQKCDKNLTVTQFSESFPWNLRDKIFDLLTDFFFLCSDSSDPKADDSDDQTARGSVSSLQRRASLPSAKQGREPEERAPELRGLGVCRGASSTAHILCLSIKRHHCNRMETTYVKEKRSSIKAQCLYLFIDWLIRLFIHLLTD